MAERTHLLKTLPRYFEAIADRRKTFEVRRDDRAFAEGDVLVLRRWDPAACTSCVFPDCSHRWVGGEVRKRVSYVLPGGLFGIDPDYVVLGLEDESVRPLVDIARTGRAVTEEWRRRGDGGCSVELQTALWDALGAMEVPA